MVVRKNAISEIIQILRRENEISRDTNVGVLDRILENTVEIKKSLKISEETT